MEHNDCWTLSPRNDEQLSNADLYRSDLPSWLAEQLDSLYLDNEALDSEPLPTEAQSNETLRSPERSTSPCFTRPPAWAAIDRKHNERVANEKAADVQMTVREQVHRLRASLDYRQEIINRAITISDTNQLACIVPQPWSKKGLRVDAVRHPRLLEEYISQELDIGVLMTKRRVRLRALDKEIQELSEVVAEIKYLNQLFEGRRGSLTLAKTKALVREMLGATWDQLVLDVDNDVERSLPVSDMPIGLRSVIVKDEKLYDLLQSMWEVESHHFPELFVGKRYPRPDFRAGWDEEYSAPDDRIDPVLLEEPRSPKLRSAPYSLSRVLQEAARMLTADERQRKNGNDDVHKKPSVMEQWISPQTREKMVQWTDLRMRFQTLRGLELRLFPGRFPTPAEAAAAAAAAAAARNASMPSVSEGGEETQSDDSDGEETIERCRRDSITQHHARLSRQPSRAHSAGGQPHSQSGSESTSTSTSSESSSSDDSSPGS